MKLDPAAQTISSARASMELGEFSALSLNEACLHRIEQLNPMLNAFILPTPEMAVLAALSADTLLSLRPSNLQDLALLGIPVALKDLFDTAGVRTTGGSKFYNDTTPTTDAEAVLRLRVSGATLVGKTNTHEIALGVTGVNPHFGAVKNPWDVSRISGGSSSGSAVAVATGMCLLALGTDTGGSVRIPASLCGVVGLKPSRGRISTRGVQTLSWNLDHVGILTRTTFDAAIGFQALAGFDPHDPASVDLCVENDLAPIDESVKGWRIALAVGEYFEATEPVILAGVMEAGKIFKDLGAQVENVDLSWIEALAQANSCMTQADAAAYHHERLAAHPDWFGEDVRQRLETGASYSSREYVLARRTQSEGVRQFEQFFSKFDLLILPTTPIPAPPIEGTGAIEAARQLTRYTSPFNLTGLPALSIPGGLAGGLPFGVQFVARKWDERKVLQAGEAYERVISAGRQPGFQLAPLVRPEE